MNNITQKTEQLRQKNAQKIGDIDAQWLKYAAVELIDDYEGTEEDGIDMIIRAEEGNIIQTEYPEYR